MTPTWHSDPLIPKENGHYAVCATPHPWPEGYPPFEIWRWEEHFEYLVGAQRGASKGFRWTSHDWQTGQWHDEDSFPVGARWIEIDPLAGSI